MRREEGDVGGVTCLLALPLPTPPPTASELLPGQASVSNHVGV